MFMVWLCLLCFLLYLLYTAIKRYIRRKQYRLPPGPKGYMLLGHVNLSDHLSLLDHKDKYGDISYINVLGTDIVILNSYEVIREAFTAPETCYVLGARPETFGKTAFLLEDDLMLSSPGEPNWRAKRTLFHTLLKAYGDGKAEIEHIISDELKIMIVNLQESCDANKSLSMKEFLEPSLFNILDILVCGLRHEYNHWRIKLGRENLKAANAISAPLVDTLLKKFPFIRHVPFGIGKKVKTCMNLNLLFTEYIFNIYFSCSEKEKQEKAGILFELYRKQSTHNWVKDETIKGFLTNIYGAGMLTTQASLNSFFLLILHYPDVQTKIQTEIDEVIGIERKPSSVDRNSMPYTYAAVLELFRYTSIVSLSVPHASSKDVTLRGYTIPEGSIILTNLFRVLHDDKIWENPWKYEPQRFLDENGDLLPPEHPKRQHMIAFGVGKRSCAGEIFAKTRIFLFITYLLQAFSFLPDDYLPSYDAREFITGMTLQPKEFNVKIQQR